MAKRGLVDVPVVLPASASRDDWEFARTFGLGGSDVAAACGLNPWKTPFQLWLEKTRRINPEFDDATTERMYWGNVLEPVLLREWDERHTEYILTGGEGIYSDREHEWMLANVDGLAWHPSGELAGIVEAKTGGHRAAEDWADDKVPIHYVCQAQWYMRLLDAPRTFMVALLDTNTYLEREIERDEDLITDLADAATEFWGYVQRDEPPPSDGSEATRKALSRWPSVPDETAELDPLWHKHIGRRHELSEQIKALEAERTIIDNELRAAMGEAEVAEIDGQKVASHKAPAKPSRSVDYEAFIAEQPDLYAQYVTERPAGRRLTYTSTTARRDQL
ncbi:lambda-exonuclease family protein [Saccharopolyspora phatthalungensis]|uniref:Putative phage-type endonuclease n=1 Tax=Saccharopolyspora phatthalungensis TaxID=664693 RepID=A0A840QDG0_9PSEU|nr:YqaJ viral recombinase family protein [Saccharopolyspora phatthalungensis]MBB5154993.1 putative phage-type endonuclease [Saccharopolyspora phatthalungensis]